MLLNGCECSTNYMMMKLAYGNMADIVVDSYSSWQKGAIENTNKLIRQYIPKSSDFSLFSDSFIRSVQFKINRCPREKLNFNNPKNEFFQNLL